jgi:hypothetical protein
MSIACQDIRRPLIGKRKERDFRKNATLVPRQEYWELRYDLTQRDGNTVHNPYPIRLIHLNQRILEKEA